MRISMQKSPGFDNNIKIVDQNQIRILFNEFIDTVIPKWAVPMQYGANNHDVLSLFLNLGFYLLLYTKWNMAEHYPFSLSLLWS